MHSRVFRLLLGIALLSARPIVGRCAEEETKTLPTLLIKGEVVSLDTSDPAATLLKVKDRYGFETPIYLGQEAKITQGDTVLAAANLSNGTAVEVEYNFDINTAKRHAVSVKVAPAQAPPAPTAEATPPASPDAAPAAAASEPAPAAASQPAQSPTSQAPTETTTAPQPTAPSTPTSTTQ